MMKKKAKYLSFLDIRVRRTYIMSTIIIQKVQTVLLKLCYGLTKEKNYEVYSSSSNI